MDIHLPEIHATGFRALLEVGTTILGEAQLQEILTSLGVSAQELADPQAWFSLAFAEALIEQLEARTNDPRFLDKVASSLLSPKHMGPIYPLVRAFGTPGFTYTRMASIARRVNRVGAFKLLASSRNRVRLGYSMVEGGPRKQGSSMCRLRIAQLTALPTLFGMAPAQVEHPECMQRGDDSCVYEIRWEEPRRRGASWLALFAGCGVGLFAAWAGRFDPAWSAVLTLSIGSAGWGAFRVFELRRELSGRIGDLEAHREALTRSAQANEQRYADLLEAKAEVDKKVEQRTAELREATQRLSGTLSEIQALDRAKTDFFNNVSHELRSPLTLILAPLDDIVAGRTPPGGQRSAFEAMHRNAARLLLLINQLLDLAKIDAGEMKIVLAPTDLLALLQGLLKGFEAAARKKGVALELQAPASMLAVAIDATWIESAITNLVANALRLARAGGFVHVVVEDHGWDVCIAVADDGPGIALQDQGKIFERFAQGDSSKRVIGGTGIGLALVREAARLHGGDVSLVSELDKGATFTLKLPRRPGDLQLPSAPVRAAPHEEARLRLVLDERFDAPTRAERPGPTPNAPFALVVEDNPELREFMLDVLAVRYRVRAAQDGKAGVALAIELNPDVVISDIAMPEMDGLQLCRALRAEPQTRTTPILLVTARTDVASVLEGFEAGANDYVLKPFHGRELLARVDVHVRLRRIVQELALRERHATLGVLAASVAHQVRNPLTTLVSGLPAMRSRLRGIDPSTQGLIDVMIDCAGRIERLTGDLMDLSRVDRDANDDFRPSEGLQAAVRLISSRIPTTVTIEDAVEESPVISGKPGEMNHVFLNVLDNAFRAVSEGGRIRVTGLVDDAWYTVRIEDSGAGIDDETARRIFEPFFTTRPAGEGTGLGLAIARQVMEQAGGTIDVGRSELGGAVFTLRIPLAAGEASGTPPALALLA